MLERNRTLVAGDEVCVLRREQLAGILYQKCLKDQVELVEDCPQSRGELNCNGQVAPSLGHKLGDAVDLEGQSGLAEVEWCVG